MSSTIKLAPLALFGAIGPFVWLKSVALEAANPADSDANSLATIVVTSEKREEALKDVPMSITALGGGSLDKLQDRDFAQYAAMVPGLSLVSTQPGLTQLTLRGQNAGGVGSTVAVYLDESPFGSSSALLNGSIISGDFDTWDLEARLGMCGAVRIRSVVEEHGSGKQMWRMRLEPLWLPRFWIPVLACAVDSAFALYEHAWITGTVLGLLSAAAVAEGLGEMGSLFAAARACVSKLSGTKVVKA